MPEGIEFKSLQAANNLPKVLVIGLEPFNVGNATGITLSNLFRGWDKDRLAQVYVSESSISDEVCDNYFRWNPKNAVFDFYIRRLILLLKRKKEKSSISIGAPLRTADRKTVNQMHRHNKAVADFSPIFVPRELYRWVERFGPDVIYCMLGNVRMINLTIAIAKRVDKPIVPHFMDDWLGTLYTQNEILGFANFFFKKRLATLFSLSNGGLCISESMVNEYSVRYKRPFIALGNPVDESHFCRPSNRIMDGSVLLKYVGGLHLNRWKPLVDISRAIQEINEFGSKIILNIYAPETDVELYSKHFEKYSSTTFEGTLKNDEVFKVLKDADILVYVESFDENYSLYTRFSLSTKIPQYMAAGKPILAYGPVGLASIEHIQKCKAGLAIGNNDYWNLKNGIIEMTRNPRMLNIWASNGFDYAKEHYSKKTSLIKLASSLNRFSRKS